MSFLINKRGTRCRAPGYMCGKRHAPGGMYSRRLLQVGHDITREIRPSRTSRTSRTPSRGEMIYQCARRLIDKEEVNTAYTNQNIPFESLSEVDSAGTATTSSNRKQKCVKWNDVLVESVVEVSYEEDNWADGMTEGGFKREEWLKRQRAMSV